MKDCERCGLCCIRNAYKDAWKSDKLTAKEIILIENKIKNKNKIPRVEEHEKTINFLNDRLSKARSKEEKEKVKSLMLSENIRFNGDSERCCDCLTYEDGFYSCIIRKELGYDKEPDCCQRYPDNIIESMCEKDREEGRLFHEMEGYENQKKESKI